MPINRLVVGAYQTNCYIVYGNNGTGGLLIDPGDQASRILDYLHTRQIKIDAIILTHGHPDHISATAAVKKATAAKVYMHLADRELMKNPELFILLGLDFCCVSRVDHYLAEGQTFEAAGEKFQVLHTPGHSKGSICLYNGETLFSGDLLFNGGVGRCDLPGGDEEQLRASLKRLMALPGRVKVYPGHGPETTIGDEARGNYYVNRIVI